MVNTVHIAVTHIDSYGAQCEAILLAGPLDGDGGAEDADRRRVVAAGGRVPRGWVGGDGAWGHGAGQRRCSVLLHCGFQEGWVEERRVD